MVLGKEGTLFVGPRTEGNVYAVKQNAQGGKDTMIIASGLNMPNGVAFKDNALYVGITIRQY